MERRKGEGKWRKGGGGNRRKKRRNKIRLKRKESYGKEGKEGRKQGMKEGEK